MCILRHVLAQTIHSMKTILRGVTEMYSFLSHYPLKQLQNPSSMASEKNDSYTVQNAVTSLFDKIGVQTWLFWIQT